MTCRAFTEGVFIYLLISNSITQLYIRKSFGFLNKKKMFFFAFTFSFISAPFSLFCSYLDFRLLLYVAFVFIYFWNKQRQIHKKLVTNYNGARDIRYALSTAIILVLAVESSDSISHILIHTLCTSTGIYNTINSVRILRELYKTAIMLLDIFFIFLVYKFQFIKMKDIKAISMNKWIPALFGMCLLSSIYIRSNYILFGAIPSIIPYRDILLWILAFILPIYWGFYLIMNHQTKLLNFKENHTVDKSILIWLFNPSAIETNHLDIYDSDVFTSNFEAKKFALKEKLEKLGINDECKGYSELILCLFLTKLFVGLKGWKFEREVFGQASLIIDVPILNLRTNIENIIKQVWFTSDSQDLINGYYLPYHNIDTYDQTRCPTVEEFLTKIAKSI